MEDEWACANNGPNKSYRSYKVVSKYHSQISLFQPWLSIFSCSTGEAMYMGKWCHIGKSLDTFWCFLWYDSGAQMECQWQGEGLDKAFSKSKTTINKKWTNHFNYKVITKQLTENSEIARNIDHNENQKVVFDTTQVHLQNTLHDRQTDTDHSR